MPFPDVTSARRPLTIGDILIVVAIAALPLAAVGPSAPAERVPLAMLMLVLGGLLWWMPGLAARYRRLEPLVLPLFILLATLDLAAISIAFVCDAHGAALLIWGQVAALLYVSFRW